MVIEEISSVGSIVKWANNKVAEGFVEEKLDRFFGAPIGFLNILKLR